VHVGSTCETAGGHYFEGLAEDPWLTTTYRTNQDGKGRTNFAIDGFTLSDERGIEGRTVVLHSVSGTRIACGVISGFEAAEPHEAQLEVYPGYQGQLQVTGSITFQDSKRGLKLFAKVNGLEQNTIGGIHVHVGSTCETAGGHYFDGLSSDPWTTTTYQSTATGYSRIRFRVADFSLTSERAVSGRTVVLHDSNGTRIACGVISPKA
jgi:Cu/Zn superoxide dismutase